MYSKEKSRYFKVLLKILVGTCNNVSNGYKDINLLENLSYN